MSVKVMIVDDEHLSRALIKLGMEWEANGFEMIGEADSGKTALAFMEQNVPDVLFTDICMPFMDGLELSEKVRERYPKVKIVIMTGHREFEYAQRAVKLGVTEFLLKPINNEEVLKVVLKLKKEVAEQREREREIDSIRTQLSHSLPIMREHFVYDLVHGKISDEQLHEQLRKYGLEFVENNVSCLFIKLCLKEHKEVRFADLKKSVINAIGDYFTKPFADYGANDEDIVLLTDGSLDEEDLLALKETINGVAAVNPEYSFAIGIGGTYNGVRGAAQSYREAKDAVKARIIYGNNRIIYFNELNTLRQENSKLLEGNWYEFSSCIKNGMIDKAMEYIHNYIRWISGTGSLDIQIIRLLCTNVVTINITVLHELGKKTSQVFPGSYDVFNEISRIDTLKDMEQLLCYFVAEIINYIQSGKEKKTSQLVEEAKKYIEERFCDQGLSLKSIAKSLYVNESYLSRVFKAEAGENITDYVFRCRINKAIEYLNGTNLKAYEISERVGFNDSHYFSLCFKKHTGKSINEYRKSKNI